MLLTFMGQGKTSKYVVWCLELVSVERFVLVLIIITNHFLLSFKNDANFKFWCVFMQNAVVSGI